MKLLLSISTKGITAVLSALTLFQDGVVAKAARKPSIVVVMSDDQDARLGSFDAQPYIRDVLMAQGISLQNHFATVAQCCPSRTSYLRGQAAHNTNLTHVTAPGGGWEKFVYSGQDSNYLPHWLKSAGYRTEYIGKLMNGYNMATYKPKPKGWDHTDLLVRPTPLFYSSLLTLALPILQLNPYTYEFNNVVMSLNGERPIFYNGYHQTDVIRAKALDRLKSLVKAEELFYIQIAPAAPHTSRDGPPVPCSRHMWSFNNATAPRTPNFNPADEFQSQKPSRLAELPRLNGSQVDFIDWSYRSRLQSLLGVDELVEDVVEFLREQERLDDTYVVYTTDNGYHVGNHRQIGGKGLPYIEDTNIPMIIRGPGIKGGTVSKTPSTHIDLAPTYLDIAGLEASLRPSFLDGRSLINEWTGSVSEETGEIKRVAKEIINIEFWGTISNGGLPDFEQRSEVYAYKTLRIVGEDSGWLFSRWCETNTTELYNTLDDPYELTNLAIHPSAEHRRLIDRLNAVLLVTKSCNQESCRDPWQILRDDSGADFMNLEQAMDSRFDTFFAALPSVGYRQCMDYQDTSNEYPYYPPESIALASQHRLSTENYPINVPNAVLTPGNIGRMGSIDHRYVSLKTIMETARNVTDEEIGNVTVCAAPLYCNQKGGDQISINLILSIDIP
ncbi:hypothetical protein NM208_g866 [Fusarium decemcellulare]|uniref:Uncharacterized protein n=1 Tax=Fusarium decemcellulare TaxID=57161 RepID=A0ACC1SXU9_9HYPO|nr:hypothetical protein NM208_g866 [Fusarium decemcellulare]